MIHPYELYLSRQFELPEKRNHTTLKRAFPAGEVRRDAYRRALEDEPDRADLWFGYARETASLALYGNADFDHCLEIIAKGERARDRGKAHAQLRELRRDLEEDRRSRAREGLLDDSRQSRDVPGNAEARALCEREIRQDPQAWSSHESLIAIHLAERRPEEAIAAYERYRALRAGARLNAVPYLAQSPLIGYLAQTDLVAACDLIRQWQKAASPSFRDEVRYNPLFRHLFADDNVDAYDLPAVLRAALDVYGGEQLGDGPFDEYLPRDSVLSAWKVLARDNTYVWMIIERIYGQGVSLYGDFVVRPDVLDHDKVGRFPNASRSNIRRQVSDLDERIAFPSYPEPRVHGSWRLTKVAELPAFVEQFLGAMMDALGVVAE